MAEYYVSTSGNNANDGLAADAGHAWKTLQYSCAQLAAGDTLYIRAGIYRERVFYYGDSGTEANPITIRDYGDGDVNLYAERSGLGSWASYSGQIYSVDYPTESMTPSGSSIPCLGVHNIIIDDVPLLPKNSLVEVVAGSFYYDGATDKIYAWCWEGGSPEGRNVGIVETYNDSYGSWMHGLMIYGAGYGFSWITVKNINIRYAPNKGLWISGEHHTVENLKAYFNNSHGINVNGSIAGNKYTYNLVKDCNVYFNVMHNYPRGRYNNGYGGWAGGLNLIGSYYSTVQNCIVRKNHGEGLVCGIGASAVNKDFYVTLKDNKVYDNYSENIYNNHGAHLTIERNLVYSNTPDYDETWEYCTAPGEAKKRCLPMGIGTSDEEPTASQDYAIIRNNIIIGCRHGIHNYNHVSGYGYKHWHILNNTVVMPNSYDYSGNKCRGISLSYGYGTNVDVQVRNNIFYTPHTAGLLMYCTTDPTEAQELFYEMNINSNNLYAPNNASPIKWGPVATEISNLYSHSGWLALAGSTHGSGDVTVDPGLVNISLLNDTTKKALSGSSAIVDAGVTHAEVTDDYDGTSRPVGTYPDMGAYEYTAGSKKILFRVT